MKTIKIKSIKITNFKGINHFESEFGQENDILAYNGLGKSSIADAIFWVLWGKDQQERKDHEIKNTVDTSKNRQDHTVEVVLDVDGRHIPIKRVYAEKWTKRRGSNDQEFTGHQTDLFFDEVPVPLKDFAQRVNDILEESIFKLVTNPHYFNSLNWKDRRKMLIDMAGEISNEDVAKGREEFLPLLEQLKHKSLEDYKYQISSQRKKTAEELKDIPVKIKEANHNMPEALNWASIEKGIEESKKELTKLDDQIQDKSKALEAYFEKEQQRQFQINKLKTKLQNLKWDAEQEAENKNRDQGKELRDLRIRRTDIGNQLKSLTDRESETGKEIKLLKSDIEGLKSKRAELLEKYHTINGNEFSMDGGVACPTCKRDFEGEDLEQKVSEMKANFNNEKLSKLSDIKTEGTRIANAIKNKESFITNLNDQAINFNTSIQELSQEYAKIEKAIEKEEGRDQKEYQFEEFLTVEYKNVKKQIEELEAVKTEDKPEIDVEPLKAKKLEVQAEIDELKEQLADRPVIDRLKERISELEKEERTLANKVSELEGIEYLISEFINTKMTMIEESINSRFQFVRFKMFNILINGGTEETCETMLDDVPWSTLNTGGKLKAGIDIINAFCKYYEVTAPMILDNRESVFDIPETENQVINLIASKAHKKLTVQIQEKVEA
ncbi:AAA family ATPase [Pleomorphovibrio marinus]|uniref:AAA family ATPase n=1 Tax=Pleomorphovibrio marinus TaxID=2164132 RepID=UPI000E0C0B16|nr:AAA family ATPase [Pleomorphovibrio marinus]